MVIVGVPMAEARCCGAESFVTSNFARPINSDEASNDNEAVPSTTPCAPEKFAIDAASEPSAGPPTIAILKRRPSAFASCA